MILRDITESRRTTQQTIESERLNRADAARRGRRPRDRQSAELAAHSFAIDGAQAAKADDGATSGAEQSIEIARSEVNRLDSIVTQFLRAIRPSRRNCDRKT